MSPWYFSYSSNSRSAGKGMPGVLFETAAARVLLRASETPRTR